MSDHPPFERKKAQRVSLQWRPAGAPPRGFVLSTGERLPLVAPVLCKGGNYVVTEGVYVANSTNIPAGFYTTAGGQLFRADWVEYWFPMPEDPQ